MSGAAMPPVNAGAEPVVDSESEATESLVDWMCRMMDSDEKIHKLATKLELILERLDTFNP